MERKFVLCDCGFAEHQVILTFDPDEDDERFQMLYLEVHLRTWKGFFKRLWYGLRYACGYHCKYGAWDEIMVNKEGAKEIRDFIDKFMGDDK
jgi:hypothetical protein